MWLFLVIGAVAAYLLLKLVRLIRADADLVVLSKKMKPEYFHGRVVWVTGASSGIGEQLSYQLSEMGAKLIISTLEGQQQEIEEVKKKLANPDMARVLLFDLSDPEATSGAAEKAKQLFGKIDILINNAGIAQMAFFGDVQEHAFRLLMEVDLFAPWILTHDTLQGMLDEGFGHIVNMCSVSAKSGHPQTSSYSSAKYGLHGLMDSIRYEMVDKNVCITNSFPGPVDTGVVKHTLDGEGKLCGKDSTAHEEKHKSAAMSAKRCAELTLIAVSNKLQEVWVSPQPYLITYYCAQYMPGVHNYLMKRYSRDVLKKHKKTT